MVDKWLERQDQVIYMCIYILLYQSNLYDAPSYYEEVYSYVILTL